MKVVAQLVDSDSKDPSPILPCFSTGTRWCRRFVSGGLLTRARR